MHDYSRRYRSRYFSIHGLDTCYWKFTAHFFNRLYQTLPKSVQVFSGNLDCSDVKGLLSRQRTTMSPSKTTRVCHGKIPQITTSNALRSSHVNPSGSAKRTRLRSVGRLARKDKTCWLYSTVRSPEGLETSGPTDLDSIFITGKRSLLEFSEFI